MNASVLLRPLAPHQATPTPMPPPLSYTQAALLWLEAKDITHEVTFSSRDGRRGWGVRKEKS